MLLDNATFLPELAFIHWAPLGATAPTDDTVDDYSIDNPDSLGTGMSAWRHLGHTDLDEDIKGDEEGGKTKVLGTRQKPNMRTRIEPVTDFFVINAVQFSPESLRLYYGGGTEQVGKFLSPRSTTTQDLAVLLIFVDGEDKIGEYHPKCTIGRGGPINREAENFLRMPLRFTPLDPGNGASDTQWLSSVLFNATPGDA